MNVCDEYIQLPSDLSVYDLRHTNYLVFHDAARSAEIEIDIVPLSHPLAHLRGNLLLIYREKEDCHVH